jgi:hypothetical protein
MFGIFPWPDGAKEKKKELEIFIRSNKPTRNEMSREGAGHERGCHGRGAGLGRHERGVCVVSESRKTV